MDKNQNYLGKGEKLEHISLGLMQKEYEEYLLEQDAAVKKVIAEAMESYAEASYEHEELSEEKPDLAGRAKDTADTIFTILGLTIIVEEETE